MIKEFLIRYFWVVKLFMVVLLFLSIFMMWKICHVDFTKKLGAPLGKPYKRTKENEELAKKLSHRSDMWSFVFIICILIMCIDYISKTIQLTAKFISSSIF